MASIRPHRDGYRAYIQKSGFRQSKTFRTKREALAWATQREAQIASASDAPPKLPTHTLRDAMIRYADDVSPTKRGARWEKIRLAKLGHDPLADINLLDITPERLGQWRDDRLRQVSAGSVLREIGLLGAVLECARREWRWIETNPLRDMRKPRSPDHRERIITRWEIRAVLNALGHSPRTPTLTVSQSVARCFLLALRTGMRAGELCGLTWAHVRPGECHLPVTKTVPRNVPLSARAERVLGLQRGFDPVSVFSVPPPTLDALFRRARTRAGLSGFTFHDARHTAATWIVSSGKLDVLTLCKMFGWSNTTRALTYFNPKAADIAKRL